MNSPIVRSSLSLSLPAITRRPRHLSDQSPARSTKISHNLCKKSRSYLVGVLHARRRSLHSESDARSACLTIFVINLVLCASCLLAAGVTPPHGACPAPSFRFKFSGPGRAETLPSESSRVPACPSAESHRRPETNLMFELRVPDSERLRATHPESRPEAKFSTPRHGSLSPGARRAGRRSEAPRAPSHSSPLHGSLSRLQGQLVGCILIVLINTR